MEICITPIGDAESIGLIMDHKQLSDANEVVSKTTKSKATRKPKAKTNDNSVDVASLPLRSENKQKEDSIPAIPNFDLNVLFSGTCLAKDSTFNEHYDFIQFKMNDVFENWNHLVKKTDFVLASINEKEQKEKFGVDQLKTDKYFIGDGHVYDQTMIDFLQEKKSKYDVILLLEAHNLMEVFLEGNEEERTLFDPDIKTLYDKIKIFYDSFKNGGIMVNIHYKSTDKTLFFCSLEDFYTTSSIWSLDVHIFLLHVMNQLFSKLESGIYQKVQDKNVEEVIQNAYQQTVEQLVKINSDLLHEEGKNQKLVQKIDETFFKNSLEKNKSYFWEKAVFYSMSQFVKNVLRTDEEQEE